MKWCVGRTLHLHASRKFGKINPLLPCEFNGDEVEYLDVFPAFRGFDAVYSLHQLTLDIYSYRHATKDMIRIHKLNGNPDLQSRAVEWIYISDNGQLAALATWP